LGLEVVGAAPAVSEAIKDVVVGAIVVPEPAEVAVPFSWKIPWMTVGAAEVKLELAAIELLVAMLEVVAIDEVEGVGVGVRDGLGGSEGVSSLMTAPLIS
jgi:hypothetical protein